MRQTKLFSTLAAFTLVACGGAKNGDHTEQNIQLLETKSVSSKQGTTAAEPDVKPIETVDLDVAAESKTFSTKDRNVFVIADFSKKDEAEPLNTLLKKTQTAHQGDQIKIYRVDIHAEGTTSQMILEKYLKNSKQQQRTFPIAIVAHDPEKMIALMEGQTEFKIFSDFIARNFETKHKIENIELAENAIMFSSPTCGYCKDMKPIVAKLAKDGYAISVKSTDTHPGEAQAFGVSTYPTFVFFDANGKEITRIEGKTTEDNLKNKLKK